MKQARVRKPAAPAAAKPPWQWLEQLVGPGVLFLTAAAYLRSLGNRFSLDDLDMIVGNRLIGQWSFIWRSFANDPYWYRDPAHLPQSSYYRPLQDIWLGLQFHLFGLNPAFWHATLVALHLVAVWLVFKIAAYLTRDRYVAALAALLFGLIPIHAEAVSWEPGVDLSLSGTFALGAFFMFITRRAGIRLRWSIALLLYLCALFTHEAAVAFPALIAIYVALLEAPDKGSVGQGAIERAWFSFRPAVICAAPFAAEVVIYLTARRLSLGFLLTESTWVTHVTAARLLLTLPRVIVTFLALLAIPWNAGPHREMLFVTSVTSPGFYLSIMALLLTAGLFFLIVRANPSRRMLYLFCAGWMGIALAPMMNLRLFYEQAFVQDRYLYLVSVGWCVIVADLAAHFAGPADSALRRGAVWASVALLLALYANSLWRVEPVWRDNESYYKALTERYPRQADGHYGLGIALEQRGDFAGAQRELGKAVELDPATPALYDLGVVDSRLGNVKKAAAEEAEGLKRLPNAPADSWVGLAQIYDLAGDRAKSEQALQKAESMPGGAYVAALARAQMSINHKDFAAAEKILRELSAAQPNDPRVWAMLGIVTGSQKNFAEALSNFDRAIALAPRDTFSRFWAAYTLYRLGRVQEAMDQCRAVLALAPNDRSAQVLLAKLQTKASAAEPPPER